LLRRFGSLARVKQLSVEELAAEMPRGQAQRVFDGLKQESNGAPSVSS
jgi:excinuclease UvrABC nuclease subunit